MATIAATARTRPQGTLSERFVRFWNKYLLFIYTGLAVVYLMLPVVVMALFSFNDPAGRSNLTWRGFSLDAWFNPLGRPGLGDAVANSLLIAFIAIIVIIAVKVLGRTISTKFSSANSNLQ